MHACMRVVRREPTGSALFLISFLVKRYGSLRGHFTLGRIQRDAQRTDVTEIDLSARRDYRCDGNASTEFPVFTELPLLQMNETKGTVRGSKSSVICLARLLRDAFIERIECLREREKDSGDSGANSRPFERMTINEATV